jgi:hypothetical protein
MRRLLVGLLILLSGTGIWEQAAASSCSSDPFADDAERLYRRLHYDYAEVVQAYEELLKLSQEEQRLLMQRPYTSGSSGTLLIPGAGSSELERSFLEQLGKLKIAAKIKVLKIVENALNKRRFPRIEWWTTIGWYFYYDATPCTLSGFKARVKDAVDQLEAIHQLLVWRQRIPEMQASGMDDYEQRDQNLNLRIKKLSDALSETVNVLENIKDTITPELLVALPSLISNPSTTFFQ